jgi:hypothetical protein
MIRFVKDTPEYKGGRWKWKIQNEK